MDICAFLHKKGGKLIKFFHYSLSAKHLLYSLVAHSEFEASWEGPLAHQRPCNTANVFR